MAKTDKAPEEAESSSSKTPAEQEPQPEYGELAKDVKNMAMLCHLLGIVGLLGPLIVWLICKDKHKFVNDQGKEAMNFQLTVLICLAVLLITVIGAVLVPLLVVLNTIFVVIAGISASDGRAYKYSVAIRLIK